jgi:flagellar motility protein MotE (MotC chaperone)
LIAVIDQLNNIIIVYQGLKMKLQIKDLITIAMVSIISFPILYLIMLLVTGTAKFVITSQTPEFEKKQYELKYQSLSNRKDSLIAIHSQSFVASENAKKEAGLELEKLNKQGERISLLQQELDNTRQLLSTEREKFEKFSAQTDELEAKRIKQLAKVYGAMRASEAAQILETLDDDLLVKVFIAIGDDRQKAKIMSSLSQNKAAQLSKKIGATNK